MSRPRKYLRFVLRVEATLALKRRSEILDWGGVLQLHAPSILGKEPLELAWGSRLEHCSLLEEVKLSPSLRFLALAIR